MSARTPASPAQGRKASPAPSRAKASALRVRFWGVRGSLASPGEGTRKTGGNTACVAMSFGDETLIFDLGTGLRPLGVQLASRAPLRAHLFVSHYHWDHIAGLPFFGPAYDPRNELVIHGATRGGQDVRAILSGQMVAPYFPVDLSVLTARLRFETVAGGDTVRVGDATVRCAELNHPGGTLGYRVDRGGRSAVYASDFEHGTSADDRLVELAADADLLVFDAQYTPAEYAGDGVPPKKGWGHSTYEVGAQLARRAKVKKLALYHHAPDRDDRGIDRIVKLARALHPGAFAAREGLEVEL